MEKKIGIAFVHGIVGNNKIFEPLLPLVPQGYEVRTITLAGHGGDARDFSRASMAQWKRQVDDCMAELAESCAQMLAVGHSMGCLLMLDQAAKGRATRLFLMNPPLRIRPRLALLANIVNVAAGRAQSSQAAAAKEAYGISIDLNPLHYWGWPARYLELFAESRRVRTQTLHQVSCPITAILSARDEMVSPASASSFSAHPQARLITLPASSHFYYSPSDLATLKQSFLQFILA